MGSLSTFCTAIRRRDGLTWAAWAAALTVVLSLSLVPPTAVAQSWVTPELCAIDPPGPLPIDPGLLAEIEAGEARVENGNGRFWRVTGPGGAVSHLWGTFHSTDPLILNLPEELRAVLRQARAVALEYDPVFASRARFDAVMQGEGFYRFEATDDPYLGIDPRVRGWIEARLASLGLGADMLPFLTEAGLATMITADPCDDFASGVLPVQDNRILLLGRDAGAEIVGLEAEDAVPLELARPHRRNTALALIELYGAVLNPELTREDRQVVFTLYLQGRIGAMIALEWLGLEEFFGAEKARRLLALVNGYLVFERNLGFVDSAIPLLNRGGAVIAVGAGHLPGETGLVTLLRRAGFTVERVPTPGEAPGGAP